jgi:flagellar biosynthesis protein FlhF
VHLVVPAATAPAQLARLIDAYAGVNPSRVILTKLDETDQNVAPLVGVLKQRDLPVSWFGTGQRVPEDLERATPAGFAARILGETNDSLAERAR